MRFDTWLNSLFSLKQAAGFSARRRPIETLPSEVLLLIFEAYCRRLPQDESLPPLEFNITHVCQYWRALALGLSALWANISITSNTPLPIALAYIQRSQNLPLDLDVDLRYDPTNEREHENILELWKTIKVNSHRWRRLNVHVGPPIAPSLSKDLPSLETPLLEHLSMTSDSTTALSMKPFEHTPSLKSLRLQGIPIQPFTSSIGQITRLHLTGRSPVPISIFRELMAQMVKLSELQLCDRVAHGWPMYPSQADIVTLPALTVLKLADHQRPLCVPLLSIYAPLLRSLSLYDLVAHDLPESFRESEISAQYPSLRKLTITGKSSFIDDTAFTQLARMFPMVDHFALLDVGSFFVLETCQNLHEPSLWPMLQTLSMIPVVAENILCSLISTRRPTAKEVGLKKLVVPSPIHFNRKKWISERVRIEECCDFD
ncbi:hypothetical protein BDN70DRAFT_269971 [Pholiota conissans]|uniref:F-box domain-containing protein n=1 Tax=Pholiota conissans TaxID=109636 RepID=A0A9P6CQM3_9AGAR|nr:hypothetical protein BDN70DRAFT_269971 [Pholiota conissans]